MNFQAILDKQLKLQLEFFPEFLKQDQEKVLQDTLKYMIHEIIEVERETNFKHWKKYVPVNEEKVKEELVDVFIFFMNALNIVGMGENELFMRTERKQKVNQQRQITGY